MARLFVSIAVSALLAAAGLGQTAAERQTADRPWRVQRTADGQPDLQGIWDFRTATPLERPRDLADREFLSEQEAAAFEQRTIERRAASAKTSPPVHALFWLDFGTRVVPSRRTSLVIDPPDGRIPPLTEAAKVRAGVRRQRSRRPALGPEDRSLYERCILGFNSGPPMNPGAYNNNVQIFQTPSHVAILNEMIHKARIVPLDDRPHLPTSIRLWSGDSRGHWDGETLVVETSNFTDRTNFRGSGKNLHLTERFTRIDRHTLLYEYTIDDPESFEHRWTAAVPMAKTDGPLFEYACHEGNYSLAHILTNYRAAEAQDQSQ